MIAPPKARTSLSPPAPLLTALALVALGALPATALAGGGPVGITAVGTTAYPAGALERIGALVLSPDEHSLYTAFLDAASGYAYFGTTAVPPPGQGSSLVKVALGAGAALPTVAGSLQLPQGEDRLTSSVVDLLSGFGYLGSARGKVIKIALGVGGSAPSRVAAIDTGAMAGALLAGAIDPDAGYAYFGGHGMVVKVALGAGPAAPRVVATVALGESSQLRRALIDPAHGFVYFSTGQSDDPARFYKVSLGAGDAAPALVGAVSLPDPYVVGAAIDVLGGYAYVATYRTSTGAPLDNVTPGKITKVALGAGAAPPAVAAELSVPERHFTTGLMDEAGGHLLFANDLTEPASNVVKLALGEGAAAPVEVGSIQLRTGTPWDPANPPVQGTPSDGEIFVQSGVLDVAAGYAYLGTDTYPGQVVKVRFSESGVLKGTKIGLDAPRAIRGVGFYSHAARGHARLAVYDDATPRQLLWDSGVVADTVGGGWLTVPVTQGMPAALTLPAGTFWLAWQIDSTADVPSYAAGTDGDGFVLAQPFGAFPPALDGTRGTAERWSMYLTDDLAAVPPTGTGTPTGSSTAAGAGASIGSGPGGDLGGGGAGSGSPPGGKGCGCRASGPGGGEGAGLLGLGVGALGWSRRRRRPAGA